MVGPDYRRPHIDVPEAYIYEIQEAEDTINSEWWRQFSEPILDAYIDEALLYNKNVRIAAANIIQAEGILMQTRSQLFPQIGYSASGIKMLQSNANTVPIPPTIPNPQTAFQAVLDASWNLDFWGRIRRQTEAARASLYATAEAKRNVILSLVEAVANTYIQLLGYDAQLIIAKQTLEDYKKSVDYFETQFKYGQTSKMTVAQAQTQYETAAATIPQIQALINQTENAFSVLLGRNPGSIERGKTIYELPLPQVPCNIPSEILRQRPDVIEAEQNLVAANAELGAAIALYFPSISLTGDFGNASQHLKDLFTGPARTWSYAGSIVGPLFTFGAISGQVREALGTRMAALYNYELIIQTAFSDVETALSNYTQAGLQLNAQALLVDAAKEYEHLAKLQYFGGYSPYITVLQAEIQLFPAELSWVQTRVLLYSSLVNIYGAMGGGWVILAEDIAY